MTGHRMTRRTRPLRPALTRILNGFPAVLAVAAFSLIAASASADMIGHGGMIRSIAVSSETNRVLTASFDFSAKLWRFDEQTEILSLDRHDGPVNAVRFLPGGTRAISVGADGKTVVWSLDDGSVVAEYLDHEGRVMAVDVATDGQHFLSGGWDGRIVVRDVDSGGKEASIDTGIPVVAAAFISGERIVSAGRDGYMRIFRIGNGALTDTIAAHDLGLTALDATANGKRIVTVGLDNAARIWRSSDMAMTAEFFADPVVKPISVSLDATGATAAVTYIDGLLIHFNTETGELINGFKVDDRPVMAVGISGDGRFAITAGMDESAKVWHLASGDAIDVGTDGNHDIPRPWLETDEAGAVLYRKCANCHALTAAERQRAGPHFQGLFGRPAGTVADYRYSDALTDTGIVWSRSTIANLFRDGPDRYMPGTKMPVQQIDAEDDLAALLDYMERIVPAE